MKNRDQFIRQLEQLLADIPEEERREAISYYEDYFDDAGEENEEAVLKELKSPERVARSIKADLQGNFVAGGFTEKGYEEFQDREVPARRSDVLKTGDADSAGYQKGAQDADGAGYQKGAQDADRAGYQKSAQDADSAGYQRSKENTHNDGYQKKTEYHGPFEYDTYKRDSSQQNDRCADKRKEESAWDGQQGQYGQKYQSGRSVSRRPVWATALLLLAGIVVIVILAIIFGISIIAGVACLGAGIGLIAFIAVPAAGIAVVGIGLVFLAVFIAALLAEILFCKHVMSAIFYGRRRRS